MRSIRYEQINDETGARIAKKSYNTAGQLVETTWYTGDAIYIQTTGAAVPEEYAIDGGAGRIGTFYRQDNVYAYELRDQTGNVRAVVAKSGSSLEVRGYSDYYPYGMVLRSGGTDYRYGYQGAYAEKDGETDWNAFELRMYDSRIARWLTTDPAGQFASPYIAMGGDPINGVDKDGGDAEWHKDKNGNWQPDYGDTRINENGYKEIYTGKDWSVQPLPSLMDVYLSSPSNLKEYTAYRDSHPWRPHEALGDGLVGQAFGWYAMGETFELIGKGVFGIAAKAFKTLKGAITTEEVAERGITNELSKTISVQKQARHIVGTAKEGEGYLNSVKDAQSVLDAVHSGEAAYMGTSKAGHLIYKFDGVTGTNVNLGAGITGQPTNVFMIKGTVNPTVVPTNPFWKP